MHVLFAILSYFNLFVLLMRIRVASRASLIDNCANRSNVQVQQIWSSEISLYENRRWTRALSMQIDFYHLFVHSFNPLTTCHVHHPLCHFFQTRAFLSARVKYTHKGQASWSSNSSAVIFLTITETPYEQLALEDLLRHPYVLRVNKEAAERKYPTILDTHARRIY